MLHKIPTSDYGASGEPMAKAIETCVHCGFCLPGCPTYVALGEEMDSPRGRIFLMKEVLEGELPVEDALPYIDRCLGCLGCVTNCPSGVEFGELLTPFRALAETKRKRPLGEKLLRRMMLSTLPFPGRFRWSLRLGRLARPFAAIMPGRMRDMLSLLPKDVPSAQPLPEIFPAQGKRRARVAMLAGCAQQVLAPQINWATLRVLARNGVEVVIPRQQACCGALAAHTGAADQAKAQACHNIAAFAGDYDAIVTNAAGCGSGMKEYPLWLAGEPEQEAAKEFSAQVRDVSELLVDLGIETPPPLPAPRKVAYHDACHLAHAQKVTHPPRQLLRAIGNLELLEVPEGEICCGSAGSYNIEQPEIARDLGSRKAESVLSTGAEMVATGNIGCMVQIATHLANAGRPMPVKHTMELLDEAYQAG